MKSPKTYVNANEEQSANGFFVATLLSLFCLIWFAYSIKLCVIDIDWKVIISIIWSFSGAAFMPILAEANIPDRWRGKHKFQQTAAV